MNYLEGELTMFVTDNQTDEYPREIQDNDITRSQLANSSRHEISLFTKETCRKDFIVMLGGL